jgi:hypothetical protein
VSFVFTCEYVDSCFLFLYLQILWKTRSWTRPNVTTVDRVRQHPTTTTTEWATKKTTNKQFSTSSRWQSKPKDERMLISSNQEKRISTATGTENRLPPVTRKCWLKSSFIKIDTFLSLPHHPHSLSLAPLPSKLSASPCADCTLVFALLSGKIFRFFSPSFFIN